jgi:hypothetical protein
MNNTLFQTAIRQYVTHKLFVNYWRGQSSGVQFRRNRTPELFSDALKELYSGCFGVLAHGASQPWKSNFLNWRVVSPKHVLGSLQGTALDVLATQFRKDS